MKGVFIARTFQTYLKMEEGEGGHNQKQIQKTLIVSLALDIRVVRSNQLLK